MSYSRIHKYIPNGYIISSMFAASTANRAMITNGLGVPDVSTASSTEVGYLFGVTSAIQAQLDSKALDSTVVKLTGNQSPAGIKIFTDSLFSPSVTAGTSSVAGYLNVGDGAGHYSIITQPSIAASLSLVLPTTAGASDNVLTTDGSGTLSWKSVPSLSTGTAGGDLTGTYPNPTIANNAVTAAKIANSTITNTQISSSAAIAYSKLNLANSITSSDIVDGTIVNADINASAAIVDTKLAQLTTANKVSTTAITPILFVRADNPTSSISGTLADVTGWTEIIDTSNAFNPTTGVFTAPTSGVYSYTGSFVNSGTYLLGSSIIISFNVNGSDVYQTLTTTALLHATNQGLNLFVNFYLNANDTVKLRISNSATGPAFTGGSAQNYVTIAKIGN